MGGAIGGFAIRNFNAFVNVLIPLGTPRRKLPADMMRAYRRARTSPRAESVALPGAGHYVQEESPAEESPRRSARGGPSTWRHEHDDTRAGRRDLPGEPPSAHRSSRGSSFARK